MCPGRDPEMSILKEIVKKKSRYMTGYYCGSKIPWSLKATEQVTLGTKLESWSWFKKIQRSQGFRGNESAARESYRV